MENASKKKELLSDEDVEFFEELCLEFSRMLYDISEENNRIYCSLLARNQKLEALCAEYEKSQGSISGAVKIRLRRIKLVCCGTVKRAVKKIAKEMFGFGKRMAIRLGIKDKLKQTKLFRALYLRGTIDKLRK